MLGVGSTFYRTYIVQPELANSMELKNLGQKYSSGRLGGIQLIPTVGTKTGSSTVTSENFFVLIAFPLLT
jgi:hypothetical protein